MNVKLTSAHTIIISALILLSTTGTALSQDEQNTPEVEADSEVTLSFIMTADNTISLTWGTIESVVYLGFDWDMGNMHHILLFGGGVSIPTWDAEVEGGGRVLYIAKFNFGEWFVAPEAGLGVFASDSSAYYYSMQIGTVGVSGGFESGGFTISLLARLGIGTYQDFWFYYSGLYDDLYDTVDYLYDPYAPDYYSMYDEGIELAPSIGLRAGYTFQDSSTSYSPQADTSKTISQSTNSAPAGF